MKSFKILQRCYTKTQKHFRKVFIKELNNDYSFASPSEFIRPRS